MRLRFVLALFATVIAATGAIMLNEPAETEPGQPRKAIPTAVPMAQTPLKLFGMRDDLCLFESNPESGWQRCTVVAPSGPEGMLEAQIGDAYEPLQDRPDSCLFASRPTIWHPCMVWYPSGPR